ncbi:MAG: alpha/beta hydrolase, partial [Acidobacteriota bacterium]
METSKQVTHPWSEWGGDGQQLVFVHANGFPPGSYTLLFHHLSTMFQVSAFAARPLWPGSDPSDTNRWEDLAEDLRGSMETRGFRGVTGLGHSLGGVLLLMAAAADPTPFNTLVLIDPVVFSGVRALFWGTLKWLGFGQRLPLIRGARRRRDRFPDLEAVRAAYAGKSVFSTWDENALGDYVQAAFVETGEGDVELRYSKAWEARIFELTPASVWPELRRVSVP